MPVEGSDKCEFTASLIAPLKKFCLVHFGHANLGDVVCNA